MAADLPLVTSSPRNLVEVKAITALVILVRAIGRAFRRLLLVGDGRGGSINRRACEGARTGEAGAGAHAPALVQAAFFSSVSGWKDLPSWRTWTPAVICENP